MATHTPRFDSSRGNKLSSLSYVRDRKENIPTLSSFFVEKLSRRFGKTNGTGLGIEENWIARVMILGNEEELARDLASQVGSNLGGRL